MNMSHNPPGMNQLTLTEDEKTHLLYIYRKRRNLLLVACLVMICMLLNLVWSSPALKSAHPAQKARKYDFLVSQEEMTMLFTTAFLLLIIGYGSWLYMRRIHPFLTDARNGKKETISYRIIRKQYFPHTDQYFISFDNPRYMHHEVDAAVYHQCTEGDEAFLYRAPKSKYVFDKNGRFTPM